MKNQDGAGMSQTTSPTGSKKTFWRSDKAAGNVSRSLQSIDSSTNSNQTDLRKPYDLGQPDQTSLFPISNYSQFGGSQDSFFNSSTNSLRLLGSLKPHEGLPQIIDVSNSDDDSLSDMEIDFGRKFGKDESDDDYGSTVRRVRADNPDYDFARDTVRRGSAQPTPTDTHTSKFLPGSVRLPIVDAGESASSQPPRRRDSDGDPKSPQRRVERRDKRSPGEPRKYPENISPLEVKDLAKLAALKEDTINSCLQARYKKDYIYTRCGDIMISVNPFETLGIYTSKEMGSYNQTSISDDPHLYMISAKAYQDLRDRNTDQVILVSGESGAGKTEATKLLVEHLVSMAGSGDDALQDKIIQVNPLLENFGNAKTVLNNNSSRFAKFLRLNYDEDFVLQSAKIQDFMLEKSRVVHYQSGESTYHSFYALLAGHNNPTSLYINKGQTFRITGNFSSTESRYADGYKEMYKQQQKVFTLIDMNQEERDDVDLILAAILHIGEIEFQDDENDCVIIKNEDAVQIVANLLDLDNERLTKALIERRGKVKARRKPSTERRQDMVDGVVSGKASHTENGLHVYNNNVDFTIESEIIQFSKKRHQADDERDALAKTLYEKLFGWIVRKINDALVPIYATRSGSIGILDICGFEDLHKNTFEQMCINIINEHLQNFMNRKVIQDEKDLYEAEGVALGVIDTEGVNNDAVLDMFTKKNGILDIIDESSKVEVASDDSKMVRQLNTAFKGTPGLFIPSISSSPEFTIKHFAGKVKYDGMTFIQKNCDSLGELVEECLRDSESLLVKDLFHVPPSFTGSISMSQFKFQGSKRGGQAHYKPLTGARDLSQSINKSTRTSLRSRFGARIPSFKSDIANKKTHIHYFKNSLSELYRSMATAIPYFVRCIKPNDNLKPGRYDEQRVLPQLRYNGVTEIARIRSCGLPVRMGKPDFVHRYGVLVEATGSIDEYVLQILESVGAQPDTYKIGKAQIFVNTPIQSILEEDLTELRRREEEERRRREEERRRREEEERRRREEEERRVREEEERKARALREREERKEEESKQKAVMQEKRKRDKEERKREEKRRREQEQRDEEDRIYRQRKEEEEEEDRRRKTNALREELRTQKSLNPYEELSGATAKTVKWMTPIDEVPTPASSTYDNSVYNRTGSGSESSYNFLSSGPGQRISRDTSISANHADGHTGGGNASGDVTKKATSTDWVDHFQLITEDEEHKDISDLRTMKVIKVIIYNFLFVVLLASLVVQKMCFITTVTDIGKMPGKKKEGKEKALETVSYLMLIVVMCIPHAIGFLTSLLKLMFSISKAPSFWTWTWVLCIESLHSIGLCLLVFRVMRYLDFFKIAYLLCATASIPALLKLLISDREEDPSSSKKAVTTSWKVKKAFGIVFDLFAFSVQGSASLIVLLLDFYNGYDVNFGRILELAGAMVLVSVNQWENFSDGTCFGVELGNNSWFKNKVLKIRYELQECRSFPNMVAGFIKIGLTILLAYLLADDISLNYSDAKKNLSDTDRTEKWAVLIALAISAFIAFNTSLMALKLQMQKFSFALPLFLATPATVAIQYLDCKYDFLESVSLSVVSSNSTKPCNDRLVITPWYNLPIFAAWFMSLIIVCRHIWKRQMDKDSNMNRLFLNPVYCGVLTAEQIMLNQRRHQYQVEFDYKKEDNGINMKSVWFRIKRASKSPQSSPKERPPNNYMVDNHGDWEHQQQQHEQEQPTNNVTPKIYACATMWHETRTEMVMLLKSLHRLDYDQYLRKISQRSTRFDPNYYEYEAHIFFDDAMERDDENFPVPNRWVKDLVGAMDEACSSVHGRPFRVHDPDKIVTPYGGQLVWQMPGENLLYVHLKDMDKIRNRKRWSQVMYMYYLLHYRLTMFCTNEALTELKEKNKKKGEVGLNIDDINRLLGEHHAQQSNKTFVLALDGDTDFLPSSIRILMQRMDNENVGATCGRIHPIGKGPMIWYQKFEYAIGHWLQKAAEHVFGCVLCSPGCFSLFRARALMDANVVRRYTTEPTEPSHHLQFDQGEDRWLCTLLLQRGFRIEYAAGADAWTFAPEGFFEFFNQRRRWMPSTIANILDLLATASRTRERNANFSLLYIIYNWLLMFMTLLGPGTILMMMAGAFQIIFNIKITWAYFWSIVPAAMFTLACFWFRTKWQLLMAAALSIGYGFIMVIVIVGTIITATTENIFHPSVIIMVCLLAIFFLTGICHPKEWSCLVHGILYLLCIPSGYLLLVIYSICNLNDVSWGTREVPTKAQRLEMEEKKKKKEEEKLSYKKKSFFKRMFDSGESHIYELTNLLRTVMPKADGTIVKDRQSASLPQDDSLIKILSAIEANTRELLEQKKPGMASTQDRSTVQAHPTPALPADRVVKQDVFTESTDSSPSSPHVGLSYRDDKKPYAKIKGDPDRPRWTQDPGIGKGRVITANKQEIKFWNGMMERYLLPIRPSDAEKKKTADGLRDLRNSSAFAFVLVNLLWMSLNFMFQLTEAAKVYLTYQFGSNKYEVEESVLGMSFVFLLLGLLLLQFAGMIIHRFGTLQQLLSTTKIWGKTNPRVSDIDATMKRFRLLLKQPATNDEGLLTEPPVPAEAGNTQGLSIKPSTTAVPLADNLLRSVRDYGDLLEKQKLSTLDDKQASLMDGFKRRLGGSQIPSRLGQGGSIRPELPPRPDHPVNMTAASPPPVATAALRITKEELEEMSPDLHITESVPVVDTADPQWRRLGALGKSLNLRATVFQEVKAQQIASWDSSDVAGSLSATYHPSSTITTAM